jgi:transposase
VPNPRSSMRQVKEALRLRLVFGLSQRGVALTCRMSPTTVRTYWERAKAAGLDTFALIDSLNERELEGHLFKHDQVPARSARYTALHERFEAIHSRMLNERISLIDVWREDAATDLPHYQYTRFASLYDMWRKQHHLAKTSPRKRGNISVKPEDVSMLQQWRRSNDRRKWEVAVAILELSNGTRLSNVCHKIERSRRTIDIWCKRYENSGISGLLIPRTRKQSDSAIIAVDVKKKRLVKLIHEPPKTYGINRTSWSLHTLADVYQRLYNEYISASSVSAYFQSIGYKFKKARKVLTSNDPSYRAKLTNITSVLSHLSPTEKFFSIDEFGPCSVRIRGGVALVPGDSVRTIPQRQKSKGSLICTAALELSTNQVTHFYSSKKNTSEMIKLMDILLEKYRGQEKIFLSWDSASWHMSKALNKEVERVNGECFRTIHDTPLVELVPLPANAQFLNVIESVFSGMARAIIHNSDYESVDKCKEAIDAYFSDRNSDFLKHPKRAGNKIWGKERVLATFKEDNNCKDPDWR